MTASLFIALLVVAVLLVYLIIAVRTWAQVRGARLVVCPETQTPVAVTVDVGHAITSAIREKADVRLTSCSRWPERQDCDQPCTRQIDIAPAETDPRTIAARFFSKERCAICSRRIEPLNRMTQQPGLMNPATQRVEAWDEVPTQDLPRAIATWRPLCANCTLAEAFRQRSPSRVTERERHG
jgi:hypothetical protein